MSLRSEGYLPAMLRGDGVASANTPLGEAYQLWRTWVDERGDVDSREEGIMDASSWVGFGDALDYWHGFIDGSEEPEELNLWNAWTSGGPDLSPMTAEVDKELMEKKPKEKKEKEHLQFSGPCINENAKEVRRPRDFLGHEAPDNDASTKFKLCRFPANWPKYKVSAARYRAKRNVHLAPFAGILGP